MNGLFIIRCLKAEGIEGVKSLGVSLKTDIPSSYNVFIYSKWRSRNKETRQIWYAVGDECIEGINVVCEINIFINLILLIIIYIV